MPSTHNKNDDKWWDTPDIDKWKLEPFLETDNPRPFSEESSFQVLFPKYREVYLRESWAFVTRALDNVRIGCTLDLVEGSMTVRTTRKTFDPVAILKARDVIKLLARSVPANQAVKLLTDDTMAMDIIRLHPLMTSRNKEKFVKRRQRILGPDGSTLKALQLLTDTYILVQGGTVSAMGSYKGLKEVRRVVEDTMANIHPVYHIKELMLKRELAKDPELANENWDRYLPQFKKRNLSRRRVPHKVNNKATKPYTPFPPPPEKSKIDLQIESGEYFLGKHAKERAKQEEREEGRREKKKEREKERAKAFVAPEELRVGGMDGKKDKKKRKHGVEAGEDGAKRKKSKKEKSKDDGKKKGKRRESEGEWEDVNG